jgi:hypothetical protein
VSKDKMTREQMQTEALIIESLLDAAMAMHSEVDREDCFQMIEKASARANRLNRALDSINAPSE